MRSSGAVLVVAALALVGAGPAAGVTGGFGLAAAVHAAPVPALSAPAGKAKEEKLASCHAAELGVRGARESTNLGRKIGNKAAPVACEQPPRSNVMPPDALKHATAAVLAIIR
jgi:hypothetical protein